MMNSQQLRDIQVGQRVYLFYGDWRMDSSRYSMPLSVIRVTKTQFTVAAEYMDSNPKRFMRSNGNEVGRAYSRSSPNVTLVTSASTREVNKFTAEKSAKERKKVTKEQQEEAALREKYNAVWIDDDIQDRFLKPLRTMAENAEHEMAELFKAFDGVSLEAENFYRVTDAIERENRNGNFAFGLKARDYGREQHQRFVNLIEEFETGTRYTVNKTDIGSVEELLLANTKQTLREQLNRFFGYTFSNSQVPTEADQMFIATLREIAQEEYAPRVEKIKEGE